MTDTHCWTCGNPDRLSERDDEFSHEELHGHPFVPAPSTTPLLCDCYTSDEGTIQCKMPNGVGCPYEALKQTAPLMTPRVLESLASKPGTTDATPRGEYPDAKLRCEFRDGVYVCGLAIAHYPASDTWIHTEGHMPPMLGIGHLPFHASWGVPQSDGVILSRLRPGTTDAVEAAWNRLVSAVNAAEGMVADWPERFAVEAAIVTRERKRYEAFLAAARVVVMYDDYEGVKTLHIPNSLIDDLYDAIAALDKQVQW